MRSYISSVLVIGTLAFLPLLVWPATVSVTRTVKSGDVRYREPRLWKTPTYVSNFSPVMQSSVWTTCEVNLGPEPLTTPNPLVENRIEDKVAVSFIIGTDGRVYSALILKSAGDLQDRAVLAAVRSWRYRPASCNGVPTQAEARIEFSNR